MLKSLPVAEVHKTLTEATTKHVTICEDDVKIQKKAQDDLMALVLSNEPKATPGAAFGASAGTLALSFCPVGRSSFVNGKLG